MTLPNILTFLRILVIPVIVATFFISGKIALWTGFSLFIFAAVTDYFDGYFARSMQQFSKMGRVLDPIADKLLVASTLLMMAYDDRLGRFGIIPAVVILCREILVSGLREFLAEIKVGMPVTYLAKWKTTIQLVAIPVLFVANEMNPDLHFLEIGETLLWIAALLTVITGYDYLKTGIRHFSDETK